MINMVYLLNCLHYSYSYDIVFISRREGKSVVVIWEGNRWITHPFGGLSHKLLIPIMGKWWWLNFHDQGGGLSGSPLNLSSLPPQEFDITNTEVNPSKT